MSIFGNDTVTSNSATASNAIAFNPVITALTGYGAASPYLSGSVTSNPTSSSDARGGTDSLSASLPMFGGYGSTGAGTAVRGRTDASQAYGGAGMGTDTGVALKTNSQTMMWLMLGGGLFMVMMMGNGGGRGRHR